MKLQEANLLLEPGYLPFEAGYQRLDDGLLLVAARSSLINCKGKMIDWWFSFIEHTEQYKWWHPTDHLYSAWDGERGTGRYIGGTHLIHEHLGGAEIYKLKINFRDPAAVLDTSRFAEAGVSTAVYARVGLLDAPGWAGHVIHFCRDTIYGCEMRSRFWLGDFEDMPDVTPNRETRMAIFPDTFGAGLEKHCHEEMSNLATFLPELYERETGEKVHRTSLSDAMNWSK